MRTHVVASKFINGNSPATVCAIKGQLYDSDGLDYTYNILNSALGYASSAMAIFAHLYWPN